MLSLVKNRGHDRSRWIMGRNSNHERSKIGPITEACHSTSLGPGNPSRMLLLNPLTADGEMSV